MMHERAHAHADQEREAERRQVAVPVVGELEAGVRDARHGRQRDEVGREGGRDDRQPAAEGQDDGGDREHRETRDEEAKVEQSHVVRGRGVLEMYICTSCGFVEWYCQDPESIPIGPENMSEIVDYTPTEPYR